MELKAKRLYKTEQKEKLQALRMKPGAETANAEKALKKLANAGVVQLFNAVYQAQQAAASGSKKKPQQPVKKTEEAPKAKVDFMDLIKTGTTRII